MGIVQADTTRSSCKIVRLPAPVTPGTSHSCSLPCCLAVDGQHADAEARFMDADNPVPEALLERLVTDLRTVLRADLVGIYLYGSYVSGGFDAGVSDFDLVAVAARHVEAIDLGGLGRMHRELVSRYQAWNDRIEVVYIGRAVPSAGRTGRQVAPELVSRPGDRGHPERTRRGRGRPPDRLDRVRRSLRALRRRGPPPELRRGQSRRSCICRTDDVPSAPDRPRTGARLEAGGGGLDAGADASVGMAHRHRAPLSIVTRSDRLGRRAVARRRRQVHRACGRPDHGHRAGVTAASSCHVGSRARGDAFVVD